MLRLSSRPCHLTDTDTHPNTQHTGFVHQDDIFIPTETVKEHLTFHAMLRCDPCIRIEARLRRVDRLLKAVNLEHVAHSMLGGPGSFIRGLSGGERRRVSFATELLSDPVIIFADEFTTGTFMRWFPARGGLPTGVVLVLGCGRRGRRRAAAPLDLARPHAYTHDTPQTNNEPTHRARRRHGQGRLPLPPQHRALGAARHRDDPPALL